MTQEQIKYMRKIMFAEDDNGCPTAAKVEVILDNEYQMRADTNFVCWDDDNQLVHCIRANNEVTSQTKAPIDILTAPYDCIQYLQSAYSLANIEGVLDKLNITGSLKESIMKYAKSIANQAKVERTPTPYYTSTAKAIPNVKQNLDREDGKQISVGAHSEIKQVKLGD